MSGRLAIGLDNAAFSGRLRQPPPHVGSFTAVVNRPTPTPPAPSQPALAPTPTPEPTLPWATPEVSLPPQIVEPEVPPEASVQLVAPQPYVQPALPRQQRSQVLRRQMHTPGARAAEVFGQGYHRLMLGLVSLAGLVFLIGLAVSLQTLRTDRQATAQVSQIVNQGKSRATTPAKATAPSGPSVQQPTVNAFNQYVVAPDLPRYLRIPKLGTNSRVMQVSMNAQNELTAPDDIYDTAWYAASAKPGQPGATLIEGYDSARSTAGVFYNLSKLQAGDSLQIVRGDSIVLNYRVVKLLAYSPGYLDMTAALKAVTPGKAGLNLLSCTIGSNQRVVVFAEQL